MNTFRQPATLLIYIIAIFTLAISCESGDGYIDEPIELTDPISFTDDSETVTCGSVAIEVDLTLSKELTANIFEYITAEVSAADSDKWSVDITPPTFNTDGTIDEESRSYVTIAITDDTTEGDQTTLTIYLGASGEVYSINKTILANRIDVDMSHIVPHIYITTDDGVDITSKEEYVTGSVTIDGMGVYDDFSGRTSIKGRGNTTWGYPKKPYKLKLDEDASILGLAAEKDWVLLANYLDTTLSMNAVAMKIGSYMDVPYVNTMIGVDVTLNGEYLGLYCLTEQIEIKKARINLSDDGYLLELDTHYDETWQFESPIYDLPVMVKDPDIEDATQFAIVQDEFEELESMIGAPKFPDNGYEDYIDIESVANFLIVNDVMQNSEISWPKSVYMFKDTGEKFTMGPIWDFDWSCGYNYSAKSYFTTYISSVIRTSQDGGLFFNQFLKDPAFVAIYKARWSHFKSNYSEAIIDYIDEFSDNISLSAEKNFEVWPNDKSFDEQIYQFKIWMAQRIDYLDTYINSL